MSQPTKEQAGQFALMLASGAPAREAIRYFLPEDSAEVMSGTALDSIASKWLADKGVQAEVIRLQGSDWTTLSTEEKLRYAVDKTYVEMAYFLYSRNYVELTGPERSKADTCRSVLEAKLAGVAGKLSAMEQFWSDVTSGKVKLAQQPSLPSLGAAPEGRSPGGLSNAN